MMKKLLMSLILACSFSHLTASAQVTHNMLTAVPISAPIDAGVIDERWGTPILAHGGALTPEQLEQTKAILGITGMDVDLVSVTGADLVHFLGGGNPNINMFSSALIKKGTPGSGINVAIVTPDNITRITEVQYANAMITAGITDSIVYVASPIRVTGESALTGIYKAFSDRGIELDSDRIEVAQQELETTSSIANAHAENKDFDSNDLDSALIDIKSNLADIKEQAGALATDAEVAQVVEEALVNNNLADILSSDQVNSLVSFARRFQATDAINSPELREQLGSLAESINNGFQHLRDVANDYGLIDRGRDFLSRLFNLIREMFNH